MVSFTLLDWFWLLAFLALMILSGGLFYRLGKRSESDFFLAGRGLPWWLPASSVFATHTATDSPMWVSGVIYRYGMAGMWCEGGLSFFFSLRGPVPTARISSVDGYETAPFSTLSGFCCPEGAKDARNRRGFFKAFGSRAQEARARRCHPSPSSSRRSG